MFSFKEKMWGSVIVAVFIGLITWGVVAMNNWEHRCNEAGGTSVAEFEYYLTTYIDTGNGV